MTRFRASGYHLLISAFVGSALLALFWFVLYPSPMLVAIGGHEIFLLILGIDVILGPLLTLVIFKSGKKSLKFDLAAIAVMQILAMCYGISTLLEARPVYVAANGDQFQVVLATEVTDANLEKTGQSLPWLGPRLTGTKAPEDRVDIDAVAALKQVGVGRGSLPQLHVAYASMKDEILQKAQPISALKTVDPAQAAAIDRWLEKHDHSEETAKFEPIQIRASRFTLVVDSKTAEVVGIAPFKPD